MGPLDNDAKTVRPVAGTAEIDVNDLTNTGKFEARLKIPEGALVLARENACVLRPSVGSGASRRMPSAASPAFWLVERVAAF